jgi:hypothetical protein
MAKKLHPSHPTLRNTTWASQVFDNARRPVSWLRVARRLRHSADAIFERENPVAQQFRDEMQRLNTEGKEGEYEWDEAKFPFPNFDAALMLIAFAIENLLKGLAVAKNVAPFTGQQLPKPLQTHDLYKLHKTASPNASISPDVLDFLTNVSTWQGRYPLPKSIEDFWPMDDHGRPKGVGYSWSKIQTETSAYCDALDAELRGLL